MSASPPVAASLAGSPPPSLRGSPLGQVLQVGGVVAERARRAPFHVTFENVLVTMRDGVKLAGDLYMPAFDGVPDESRQFPCVLIRTPYDKSRENPDLRNPGTYWAQNNYCCFIQDVRGRFKSEGIFYKYVGEAADGYDTVQWIAQQKWCNGSIATDGPSYLCHVQTSMALLRPPNLKCLFANKGGFFNSWTSGVRQSGAYEARQWIWGVKNAPRSNPLVKEALERVEKNFGAWLKRYPFRRGDSPLACAPEYEDFIFDQAANAEYGPYWQQVGLNTEEHLSEFADVPVLWLSGFFDIYARSTVEFFVHLAGDPSRKGPHLLIMGPWQHVGPEGHVAGDVDFGVSALISGNLAPTVPNLARKWFDRWVTPATPVSQAQTQSSAANPAASATAAAAAASASAAPPVTPSFQTRLPAALSSHSLESLRQGPSLYVLPSSLPRSLVRAKDDPLPDREPLPPTVRYFRMGGADGHKTSQGHMMHGGAWMASCSWPPPGTRYTNYFLQKRALVPNVFDHIVGEGLADAAAAGELASGADWSSAAAAAGGASGSDSSAKVSPVGLQHSAVPSWQFAPTFPSESVLADGKALSSFDYDPRDPCPSIGGNLFGYRDVLLAGAFDQVERPGHFLCREPYLPLSSRRDVLVFRTAPLSEPLDVTGSAVVHLLVSSSARDTDFTAKLIDEYPPSASYPAGYAMQITHGIVRCRFRRGRAHPPLLLEPGRVEQVSIELYPTSNLFAAGHRLRLDISSSNFPHFDTNPNTGLLGADNFESAATVVARNSVFHTEAFPSRIVLPLQTKSAKNNHNGGMDEL